MAYGCLLRYSLRESFSLILRSLSRSDEKQQRKLTASRRVSSFLPSPPQVGPCLGPIIAGYLTVEGWRANYYLLLGLAGSATLAPYLFLPETYAVVLLRRRAIALRKETGDEGFMTTQERFRKPFAEVMKTSLIRPLQLLVTEPIIFLFSVSLARPLLCSPLDEAPRR